MRRLLVVWTLAAAVAGCSSETSDPPAEPMKQVTASDGSFEISVPDGWTTLDKALAGNVVVAERDPDGVARVVGSHERSETGAEQRAITAAAELTNRGIFCERFDDDETFGGPYLVFDCPYDDGTRQLLFPVADDGRSALVVVRTRGATLESTADAVSPIIGSFSWSE